MLKHVPPCALLISFCCSFKVRHGGVLTTRGSLSPSVYILTGAVRRADVHLYLNMVIFPQHECHPLGEGDKDQAPRRPCSLVSQIISSLSLCLLLSQSTGC